jgi:hypothetical protein
MAPLAHRVVEHGVYTMPFFINPTGAKGKRGTHQHYPQSSEAAKDVVAHSAMNRIFEEF